MDMVFKELPIDYHPQQNVFKYHDGLIISSNYDSGNLRLSERIKEDLVFFQFIKKVLSLCMSRLSGN